MRGLMFFTDPHIGKNLVANTTPESRTRMGVEMGARVVSAIQGAEYLGYRSFCGGDLFDKFDNSAAVLSVGAEIVGRCGAVLGGNHDYENNSMSYSSLDFLAEFVSKCSIFENIVRPCYGEAVSSVVHACPNARVVMVPHHCDQDLFDKALNEACTSSLKDDDITTFLMLHCNYDCDHITNDTALNLTRARAVELLQHFDYILIGHDHNAKTDFDDRLIVMGSINPTCFGDCHIDHSVWYWNFESKEFTQEVVWEADKRYLEIDASDFIAAETITDKDFIRVTGKLLSEQVPELSKKVKAVWKSEKPPYALRIDATVVVEALEGEVEDLGKPVSFYRKMESAIEKDPEMLAIWSEITAELKGDAQ